MSAGTPTSTRTKLPWTEQVTRGQGLRRHHVVFHGRLRRDDGGDEVLVQGMCIVIPRPG